jgi:hypothetical protein
MTRGLEDEETSSRAGTIEEDSDPQILYDEFHHEKDGYE